MARHALVFAGSARRALNRLPASVAAAVIEFTAGRLREDPCRVGKPLHLQLDGSWSARVGVYRVIYRIDEEPPTVSVVDIDHRADIYRPR